MFNMMPPVLCGIRRAYMCMISPKVEWAHVLVTEVGRPQYLRLLLQLCWWWWWCLRWICCCSCCNKQSSEDVEEVDVVGAVAGGERPNSSACVCCICCCSSCNKQSSDDVEEVEVVGVAASGGRFIVVLLLHCYSRVVILCLVPWHEGPVLYSNAKGLSKVRGQKVT